MAHPSGRRAVFRDITFRSQFEASVAKDLHGRGVVFEYETERVFYSISYTYVTDFTIPEEFSVTGEPIYVECKGWLRPEDKRKILAIKADNPGMDLRLLFQSRNAKNIQWCQKNNIRFGIGTVPTRWLRGEVVKTNGV